MCPHLSNYALAVIFQGFLLSPCSEHCRMYTMNSKTEILFLRSNPPYWINTYYGLFVSFGL